MSRSKTGVLPVARNRGLGASAAAVAGLLFLSGLGSLVLQVGWMREFRLVFGGSTAAAAAVVAIFMGGLGLGSAVFGPRADRAPRPLRMYVRLELGIALTAALSPFLVDLVRAAYVALGGQTVLGLTGATAVRLLAATVVLAVPTLLMGGVLPAAVRAVTGPEDRTRRGAAIMYGANTLGAVTGAMLATFWLLPALGTRTTLWTACLVEVAVAAGAWWLARSAPPMAAVAAATPAMGKQHRGRLDPGAGEGMTVPAPLIYGAAAMVGFVFFWMELVWFRMLGPILGGTTYTFGLILAVALFGVGLGGASYAWLFRRRRPTLMAFAVTCALEALCLAIPFAFGDRLAIAAGLWGQSSASFAASTVGWTVIAAAVVFPAALVSGVQFPILVALAGEGDRRIGREVGFCGAWNTLGAIAGSLAGGFGALPMLTAPGAWRLGTGMLAATGLAAGMLAVRDRRSKLGLAFPAVVAAAAVALLLANGPTAVWRHSGIGAARTEIPRAGNPQRAWVHGIRRSLLWEAEGVEASVAIVADHGLSFYIDGKSDGNAIEDAGTQIMLGLLPALLHPDPQTALVVGLGTGETAGWLAEVPSMERVDVVELEPAIDAMARLCAAVNHNVLEHRKVRRIYNDAREVLLTTPERFDLIVSEPSNPYRAGIATLFTREFYEAVRARLRPGGVFVQWLQAYEVDRCTVQTVLGTLRGSFAEVTVWQSQHADMLLVCSAEPLDDGAEVAARLSQSPWREGLLAAWQAAEVEAVAARYVAGRRTVDAYRAGARHAVNTDDYNAIEYGFARTMGRRTDFAVEDLRRVAVSLDDQYPEGLLAALDCDRVLGHRQLAMAMDQGTISVPPDGAASHRARAEVLARYLQFDSRGATTVWEEAGYEPLHPTEMAILALCYADEGDARAEPLIARLQADRPGEAAALQVRLFWRHGRIQEATAAMTAAFAQLRESPWVHRHFGEALFITTMEMAASDTWVAKQCFAALSEPLAVYAWESLRLRALCGVAEVVGPDVLSVALAALEPYPIWEEPMLRVRLQAYTATGHPLASRAASDLATYRAVARRSRFTSAGGSRSGLNHLKRADARNQSRTEFIPFGTDNGMNSILQHARTVRASKHPARYFLVELGERGSGVVFGYPASHVVNRWPKTTPDPVASPMQGYLNWQETSGRVLMMTNVIEGATTKGER